MLILHLILVCINFLSFCLMWRMNWPSRNEDSDMKMSRFHYGCDVFYWPQQQERMDSAFISSAFHSCSYELPCLNQAYSTGRGKWERRTHHAIVLRKWRFLWRSNRLSGGGGVEGPNHSSFFLAPVNRKPWRINAPVRHPARVQQWS